MSTASGNFSLYEDPWGRLVLTDAAAQRHVGVEVMHAFPITEPERWVSICDAEGHELFWIENLGDLPDHLRDALLAELSRREFLPVIQRIVSVSDESDPCDWDVQTDRGPTRFLLNDEEDVHRLGPYRTLITDSHGMRYLVPDSRQLDLASRRILDRYL